jgi:hypothetical protein
VKPEVRAESEGAGAFSRDDALHCTYPRAANSSAHHNETLRKEETIHALLRLWIVNVWVLEVEEIYELPNEFWTQVTCNEHRRIA